MSRSSNAAVLGLLFLLRADPASADEPHLHDGFYLRAGAGVASLHVGRETEVTGSGQSAAFVGDHSSLESLALLGELSVGGTPFPRVALAGTLLIHVVDDAELELADGSAVDLAGPFTLLFLGPTADVFPRPVGGFHLGGGVGLIHAQGPIEDGRFERVGGLGGGATFTAGYDLWADPSWSVGLAVRALIGGVHGSRTSGSLTGSESDVVGFYGLSLTALRN